MNIFLRCLMAACLSWISVADAAPERNLLKGGTFCFTLNQPALPQWRETFKLVVQPTAKGKANQFPLVSGLQHGVLLNGAQPFEYISQQTGTASHSLGGDEYKISLTSNESGHDLDGLKPGIWIGHIALTLSVHDHSGRAIGTKQFRPIEGGKVGSGFEDAVDGSVKPIPCSAF